MAIEILTKEDLKIFRTELIDELKQLFLQHTGRYTKDWLKVMKSENYWEFPQYIAEFTGVWKTAFLKSGRHTFL